MLLNELEGRMRVIRDGKLLPEAVSGIPKVHNAPGRGGLMDIALHPNFAQNHLVYFTYDKPGEKGATQAVARGALQGNQLTGVKDVFVSENWGTANGHLSARIAFDRQGMLYVAIADHNQPENVTKDSSHAGKVVRMRDDGASPSIYATGFRDPHSLVLIPGTNDFWEVEHGDELNLVRAGGNYGWPYVTTGEGRPIGPPPAGLKLTEPFMKQWPVFHFSGLMIYDGDKFPKWKGNVFIGCLSTQEIHRVVPGKDAATFRESVFKDLGQEVRDVRQGPDGFIYFTTNDPSGRLMRVEPAR
jgi:glucose/arabinose dehydrogenase